MKNATDYLISQYYDSERIRAIIDSLEQVIKEHLEQALLDIQPQMTSQAVGYWAELLAKRFMVHRPIVTIPSESDYEFFGFGADATTPNPHRATFNSAIFSTGRYEPNNYEPANNETTSAVTAIQSQRIMFDGTQDMARDIINSVYEGSYVIDNMDMTIKYVVGGEFVNEEFSAIKNSENIFPRPAGVDIKEIVQVSEV